MPREDAPVEKPTTWVEVDLGDSEFVVKEHPDGMFTLDMPEPRLVVNAEHLQTIIRGLAALAAAKDWL